MSGEVKPAAPAAPAVAPAAAPPPPPGSRPTTPPPATPGGFRIDGVQHAELEKLLAGSIPDAKALIERVGNLAHVSIQGIRLDFTAKQLEEIATKAKRNGETPEALLKRIVKMIEPMFFSGV